MIKYLKEERLEIGKRIYEKKLNCFEAGERYNISPWTAREYFRLYKAFLKELGDEKKLL